MTTRHVLTAPRSDDPERIAYKGPRGLADQRCDDGCLAASRRWRIADDSDRDAMTCYRCGHYVCVGCQRAPVDNVVTFCNRCADIAAEFDRR